MKRLLCSTSHNPYGELPPKIAWDSPWTTLEWRIYQQYCATDAAWGRHEEFMRSLDRYSAACLGVPASLLKTDKWMTVPLHVESVRAESRRKIDRLVGISYD